ncbi:MAG: hypothetical protein MMC33_000952 [Icmadophila ericetorum]|nr:hypothetical protein [Icmadophila ericetorum]
MAASKISAARSPEVEDSPDELTNSVINETVQSPTRSRNRSKSAPLQRLGSLASEPLFERHEKPLPSLPESAGMPHPSAPPRASSKHVLEPRSTNTRVIGPKSKDGTKLKISAPTLQDKASLPANPKLRGPSDATQVTRPSTGFLPQTGSNLALDAEELSRRISALMEQVAIDEGNVMPKAGTRENMSKISKGKNLPAFLKSKEAFEKAKRAISERLSSNGSRQEGSKTSSESSVGTSTTAIAGPEAKRDADQAQAIINRRVAEGENLNNPKIRSLTGDGNIPRKPLPVYDSLKTLPSRKALKHRSYSLDDPFVDKVAGDGRPSPSLGAFDFDFDKPKSKRFSIQELESLSAPKPADTLAESRSNLLKMLNQPQPRFTDSISGLAQHPDTMQFSSSPLGCSTPLSRLEPKPSSSSNLAAQNLKAPTASILNFSFEEQSEEDTAELRKVDQRDNITSLSLSLKRKTGKANLRDESSPAAKKLKNAEKPPAPTASLVSMTALPQVISPLATKNKNKLLRRFMGSETKLQKHPTNKEPSPKKNVEKEKKGKGNAAVAKRSLFSKAIASGRPAHHRRASTSVLGNILRERDREDSMSNDELQREESM